MNDTMTTTPGQDEQTKRKRGAPVGNINALKHGFFSQRFNKGELFDLQNIPESSITEEIAMMRVITRRVMDLMENGASSEEVLDFYKVIGRMCMQISSLLRTQKILSAGEKGEVNLLSHLEEITRAFMDVGKKP
jgi:uncharacterized protein YjcR